jgi:CubicO group peptidase (beta-lactamase class C family)
VDLRARLEQAVASRELAGISAVVVGDREVVALAAAGDAGGGHPVAVDTPFLLGSITKTLTAILVMQQVETGRLDLDAPVASVLRSVPLRYAEPGFPPVTARHLLTHTAGIGELRTWRDLFRPTIGLAGAPDDGYYDGGLTVEVPPGSKWAYANHGFGLLGRLVEELTGKVYPHLLRDRVFEPLGMAATGVGGPRAGGFAYKGGRKRAVATIEVAVSAAGGVVSTAEDMGRYLACLVGGGEPVLRTETLHTMLQPAYRPVPELEGMGLGFLFDELGRWRLAGHDGGCGGCSTAMLFAPESGCGVAFTSDGRLVPDFPLPAMRKRTGLARRRAQVRVAALGMLAPVVAGSARWGLRRLRSRRPTGAGVAGEGGGARARRATGCGAGRGGADAGSR